MTRVVITGADRGLGLCFAQQYAEAGYDVVAGCLKPNEGPIAELANKHDNLHVQHLDVTNESSVASLKDLLIDQQVDILINNAGIHHRPKTIPEDVVFSDWEHTFQVNTLGPARVSFALRPNLKKSGGAKLVTITSDWGSVSEAPGTAYSYCSSKAAVNSVMRGMAKNWDKDNITIVLIHPGWTRTFMGGDEATGSAEENAALVRKVIDSVSSKDNGRFIDNQGNDLPW